MKASLLIYHMDWKCSEDIIKLNDNIYIENFTKSNVCKLYNQLSNQQKIDDGESFEIKTHIVLDEEEFDELFPYWHTPYSIISEILNILVFCTKYPLTSYRIIISKDDFQTSLFTLQIHSEYDLYETLTMDAKHDPEIKKILTSIDRSFEDHFSLTSDIVNKLKLCLEIKESLCKNKHVQNAFNFFFNAWHSHQMEYICISLAIFLESLFSPADNRELVYQIAFNTAHCLGKNSTEKEKIFKIIKDFYNLRSSIVHGGTPKFSNLYILTPVVFILCCEILEKLFLDTSLSSYFVSNQKRSDLFKKWMFN